MTASLPDGSAPAALPVPHFPDRLHAYVWRNWQLVPAEQLAAVIGATAGDVLRLGRAMGLAGPPEISADQRRRSAITVIRRNWHLLPYDQLLALLGWTEEELSYSLREDDFLWHKLGRLKPQCARLDYREPDADALARAQEISRFVRQALPGVGAVGEPLFSFVQALAAPPAQRREPHPKSHFHPRFCYSYFALYGDPLLEEDLDPYPDGYLARLADCGVDGIWLQAVLYRLARFPWEPELSTGYERRLAALNKLTARAGKYGLGLYLYLNEPRAMPPDFFQRHPQLQGVVQRDLATMCTSLPEVQDYMREAVRSLCLAVPDLAGLFTITASENLTNCWSHHHGENCPRCARRSAAEVIAEVNRLVDEGRRAAGSRSRLLVWDWGWRDDDVEATIAGLPADASLMSVSEWQVPIRRGGIASDVGEYSISAVGPGPRATRHWDLARQRGLTPIAKMQVAVTWELSAVPYIPAMNLVARHAANVRTAGVEGLMLGWTLGGYPSPNLEVVAAMGSAAAPTPEAAIRQVAERRFGGAAPAVIAAWSILSTAFEQFPYHGGVVYRAPTHWGPANLLWSQPTGYQSTMIGFPYDHLDGWRAIYPADIFARQMALVAAGCEEAMALLRRALAEAALPDHLAVEAEARVALEAEARVIEAAGIHFQSVANQADFVRTRDVLAMAGSSGTAKEALAELERLLQAESTLARRLYALQMADSRFGFEASNQYYYIPLDLAEKIVNCDHLLTRWLPEQRARWNTPEEPAS